MALSLLKDLFPSNLLSSDLLPAISGHESRGLFNKASALILEQSINRVLKLDVDASTKLAVFNNKVIQVSISDFELDYYLSFPQGSVIVQTKTERDVSAVISGKLTDFLSAAQQENSGDAIFSGDIHFSGEVKTAKLFQDFISDLNIDWLQPLRKFFGDTAAHNISKTVNTITRSAKRSHEQTQQDIPEYLQHEINVTPSRYEVNDFLQCVDNVRSQAERLGARIERLKQKINVSNGRVNEGIKNHA